MGAFFFLCFVGRPIRVLSGSISWGQQNPQGLDCCDQFVSTFTASNAPRNLNPAWEK